VRKAAVTPLDSTYGPGDMDATRRRNNDMNQPRTVHCNKLDQELPALPFKPFPTEFGQLLYDRVSMQAWQMWLRESPRYINTYRIDLQSAEGREFLEKQMRVFFGFEDGELAETAWSSPAAPGADEPSNS
jgi:Fe-S cluster biosynthesis and repair protein YggX